MKLHPLSSVALAIIRSLVLLVLVPAVVVAQFAYEDARLAASDGEPFDFFGCSVACDGNTALIGAYQDDDLAEGAGAAYVFRLDRAGWVQEAKLLASDGVQRDYFGWSCAIDGDTAVVAAAFADAPGADSGAVYVFVRDGSVWSEQAKLAPGDLAAGDYFGYDVAIDGDTLAVGARADDERVTDGGAVHVFTRSGTVWSREAKLAPRDLAERDYFGWSVDVTVDRLAVGAPEDDDGAEGAGAVYVFERSAGWWFTQAKLFAADAAADDGLGHSVSLSGERLLAGAPDADVGGAIDAGAAYVFTRGGTAWDAGERIVDAYPGPNEAFGWSVVIAGNTAGVGARLETLPLSGRPGAAFLFDWCGTCWTQRMELRASDAADHDELGAAIEIGNNHVLIGAPWAAEGSVMFGPGAAYVFELPPGPGQPLCFGDGSGSPCPCDNDSPVPGEGCLHSSGRGTTLSGHGSTSIAADDLVLVTEGCPPLNTGIYYAGRTSLEPGAPLYDGLQCAGGDARRFRGLLSDTGTVTDTAFVAQDPSGVYFLPGATYIFQYWSRDVNTASPCGTSANFSPAYAVVMTP